MNYPTTRPAEPVNGVPLTMIRNEEIDLPSLLTTLMDNKRLILSGIAGFLLLGMAYIALVTPTYEANAVVQVESRAPAVPGTSPNAATQPTQADASASTEMQLLTSRRVLGEAIGHLDLDVGIAPSRLPVVGGIAARAFERLRPGELSPARFGLSSYGWGGERIDIAHLEVPEELLGTPLTLQAAGRDRYALLGADGNLLLRGAVGENAHAGGVRIRVAGMQANPGMRFEVTKFDPATIVGGLRRGISASEQGRNSGIIALTYASTDPLHAKRVLDEVTQAYVRQNVARNSAEAAKRLEFVTEQLPAVRDELAKAQAALNEFQSRTQTLDVEAQNRALLDRSVALDAGIQQLRIQMTEAAGRYTSSHPAYRTLQRQIGQFESEKKALDGRIAQLPDTQQGLFRLSRDVEVTNQTYANLLDQAQQLNIARASAIGNARIIDPAEANLDSPAWPKPLPILAASVALGAMLMMGLVLLRQSFRRGVEDPMDIELLGMPVYASVPYSRKSRMFSPTAGRFRRDGKPRLLALQSPSDLAMEALRTLRTSLHFDRQRTSNKLMMIVAPSPGVGKTFVCANLAVTMAQAGQRVMLVDADMRRGTLHQATGTGSKDGLSELLAGKIPLEDAIRKVPGAERLSFIPRGVVPPNPSELLMHPNFSRMLERLQQDYDVVVIDTPPILAVTDAALIGHHVGTCLMVVRWGLNQQREIALAKQRLEQNGIEIKGAIFNGVQKTGPGRYAYTHYEYLPATELQHR